MTIADVLKAIADDKSLVLFNTIALSKEDSSILIRNLGITKKQYYSRLSTLLRAGLVKRDRGRYSLTRFGGILYHAQEIIGKAVNQYWRLEAIDSVRISGNDKVPHEQYHRLIDTLISNQEIKNILIERIDDKKTTIYEK
jgi:DNA-binding HxlR family transcriptional regulator